MIDIIAQHQNPTKVNICILNKQLKQQIKNIDRGIKYISLNLEQVKLFIFINGSFANNKDFSSQISYLIILINKTEETDKFTIKGNLIHYSSTKSKRVIKSILASKIYKIVGGVNMAIIINIIIKIITR